MTTEWILITGGCGFVGSHTCVEVIEKTRYNVIILDNLSNSERSVIDSINTITKKPTRIVLYMMDIRDPSVEEIFTDYVIKAVIHFAGLKSINESIENPFEYYSTNVGGTLAILKLCVAHKCCLIYSSSAMVYGCRQSNDWGSNEHLEKHQLTESQPLGTLSLDNPGPCTVTNTCSATNVMVEKILFDTCKACPGLNVVALRYFNPIGGHTSGVLGDDPVGIPNNIMPFIHRVAVYNDKVAKGLIEKPIASPYSHLKVYGNTFGTPDGTGYRDYIHVVDLAEAHLAVLQSSVNEKTNSTSRVPNYRVYNVGTGTPTSVLKLINTFCKTNKVNVPFHVVEKRTGDVGILYCNPDKIYRELGWKSKRSLETMCQDVWKQYTCKSI